MHRLFTSQLLAIALLIPSILSAEVSTEAGYIFINGGGDLTAHDPIYILGNADFASENGVIAGSGTETDPYIIEGWLIDANTNTGIQILGTSARFIIRNCCVYNGNDNDGIYFSYVVNGAIENVTLFNNRHGIYYDSSTNNRITNCTIYNNAYGIHFKSSNNNQITNSTIRDSFFFGIFFMNALENRIYNNRFINNSMHAYDMDTNYWDDGIGRGNYWDDYEGRDADEDGTGDTPYNIPGGNNTDRYPIISLAPATNNRIQQQQNSLIFLLFIGVIITCTLVFLLWKKTRR